MSATVVISGASTGIGRRLPAPARDRALRLAFGI
jgi:hypothetical protein